MAKYAYRALLALARRKRSAISANAINSANMLAAARCASA